MPFLPPNRQRQSTEGSNADLDIDTLINKRKKVLEIASSLQKHDAQQDLSFRQQMGQGCPL